MDSSDVAGTRSESVRTSNLAAILRCLHLSGDARRSDLVVATGLTRSAIGALVGELTDLGLVSESRSPSEGVPGRPSPIVTARRDNVVLAVEVLVDTVAVAAVALGGRVMSMRRADRRRNHVSIDQTMGDVTALADEVMSDLGPGTRIFGVGAAVAGVVRRSGNSVVVAPNLGWREVALGDALTEAFGLDVPVVVANDGDLGALGETRRGVARGLRNIVYISGEVGVGGGIVVDGVPLSGAAGFAGELGHIPMQVDGLPCNCGSVGCWETLVGEAALLRRAGMLPEGGRAALDALLDAAAAGEEKALDALAVQGTWLGFGLAGIVNVFDPELVVLGGSLARMHPFVAAPLDTELDRRVFHLVRPQVAVVPSALGLDAPLLGAAEWAWETVVADASGARWATVTRSSCRG